MEWKDFIVISLASGAFVISALTFYMNHIHKKVSIVVNLVGWNATNHFVEGTPVEFSISNMGNTSFLVKSIQLEPLPENFTRDIPFLISEELPGIWQPGEIKLVMLNIPDDFLDQMTDAKQKLRVTFLIIDTKAKARLAQKTISLITQKIPQEDWQPFKITKAKT